MDVCGIYWAHNNVSVDEYSKVVKDNNSLSALFVLPLLMLIFYDVIILTVCCISVIISVCCPKKSGKKNPSEGKSNCKAKCVLCCGTCCKPLRDQIVDNRVTIIISISIVAVISFFANHSYYIIIAFINDPIHANSIGIFFVISILVYLFLLKLLWKCLQGLKDRIDKTDQPSDEENQSTPQNQSHIDTCLTIVLCICAPILLGFLLAFQILVTSAFVYIPIKRTVEDVPTQISSIYHSLLIVFGALITYRIFIKKGIKSDQDKNPDKVAATIDAKEKPDNVVVTQEEESGEDNN